MRRVVGYLTAAAFALGATTASSQPADAPATAPAPAARTAPAAAPAAPDREEKAPEKAPLVELHGYVQPLFGVRHRSAALPRDRWEYGGLSSRAGLIVSGEPARGWSYVVHLSLDARTLLFLTGLDLVDRNGDGDVDALSPTRRPATSTIFEEVTIAYRPVDFFTLKMGAMRMPFTVALRSANSALLFPNRPGANEVFQSGADQGILAVGQWLDHRLLASVGVFTGTSLGLLSPDTEARGLVYSVRVDANPLGRLPAAETDFARGPVRFGVGVGGLFRNGSLYSKTGYELADTRDARASASLRFSAYGLFLQAEALRRLSTDNVTSRPNQASGAYVQGSYFIPLTSQLGLAPIARFGGTVEDEVTLPRRTLYIEGGFSFFPRIDLPRPESLRLLLAYQGERRTTDEESAHAVIAQAQLLF